MLLQGFATESDWAPIEITAMHALCTTVPHLSFNMIHIKLKFKGKWCMALF